MSNGYAPQDVERPEKVEPESYFTVSANDSKKLNFISNRVDARTLRRIQMSVLNDLSSILVKSFGPHGSNTCIKKLNAFNMYTKDGHTILEALNYSGIIEESIRDDISTITREIVNTVGDGTTSAVLLSAGLFRAINDIMENHQEIDAGDVMRAMDKISKMMDEKIRSYGHEATLQDISDISFISSNGSPYVNQLITSIYDTCGMDVFIDVAATTAKETSVKMYDGMTISSGVMDSIYITNREDNTSVVDHPEVYFFEDPIDTKEMGVLLDGILNRSIIQPAKAQTGDYIPTVIIAPRISRDMSSFMDIITTNQSNMPASNKLPITFIISATQRDQLHDLATLCGAKMIHKYIDNEVYLMDLEAGRAPSPTTIANWAGRCESVIAGTTVSKFVHPAMMKNEDGTNSNVYENLLNFVETEIKKSMSDGGDDHMTGTLKRRLHSLKSNLVEIHVGGMTAADRDANLHLIEDAVKNCRSAAKNGVGWGANFCGLMAASDISEELDANADKIDIHLINAVHKCYFDLVSALYTTRLKTEREVKQAVGESIKNRMPMNLRNGQYDGIVKSSIDSDSIILSSVMKIIGIMVTCNQYLVPSAQHNIYSDPTLF